MKVISQVYKMKQNMKVQGMECEISSEGRFSQGEVNPERKACLDCEQQRQNTSNQ